MSDTASHTVDPNHGGRSYRLRSVLKLLPLLMAVVSGMLWTLMYGSFAILHGMNDMFDQQFPFLISMLLGIHGEGMTPLVGTFFAFLDGLIAGFLIGLLVKAFIGKEFKSQ